MGVVSRAPEHAHAPWETLVEEVDAPLTQHDGMLGQEHYNSKKAHTRAIFKLGFSLACTG